MRATILLAMGLLLSGAQAASAAEPATDAGDACFDPALAAPAQAVLKNAQPVPRDEEGPPWEYCLERIDPQMCANCCQYWSEDCQDACPDPDPGSHCWMDCIWAHSHCVDACFGI